MGEDEAARVLAEMAWRTHELPAKVERQAQASVKAALRRYFNRLSAPRRARSRIDASRVYCGWHGNAWLSEAAIASP